jgi:hypothetical protein
MLKKINKKHYNWDVCGEFKMLGFLLGLQHGTPGIAAASVSTTVRI